MKRIIPIFLTALLIVGCFSQRAGIGRKENLDSQVFLESSRPQPKPDDIMKFSADPISPVSSGHFKNFKMTKQDLEIILRDYYAIGKEHWTHGYSHVGFFDRTGHLILKNGKKIEWMVRPAGLATLKLPDGKVIYLARELSVWKKAAKQAH